MLVGRQEELARINALIARARRGRGGALAIRGVAGIGKTALLSETVARARGMRVLATAGHQTESTLLFAGLSDLAAPILGHLAAVPPPQSAALRGALALDVPSPGDRFAVCAAALALLRSASVDRPILIVTDDAHWLDGPSAECLAYIARRVGGTPIAVLISLRTEDGGVVDLRDLDVLDLGPLEPADARSLLERAAPDLAAAAHETILATAAGIPLGLLELPASLAPDERTGERQPRGPLRPTDAIRRAFEGRIARLADDTSRALLVAAATEPAEMGTVAAACRAVGVDPRALEQAERERLIVIDSGRLEFGHPLARSVAYHAATNAERRRVHAALAGVTSGESRAWHLASSAAGPDEEAADALDEVGHRAVARRGYAVASAAFERSARLTPPGDRRAARFLAAAAAGAAAGRPSPATALLDQATNETSDPHLLASIEQQRGAVLMMTGPPSAVVERLQRAAQPLFTSDPDRAAEMLADAAIAASAAGHCRAALTIAEKAASLLSAKSSTLARAHALAARGHCRLLTGLTAQAGSDIAEVRKLVPSIPPGWQSMGAVMVALDTYLLVVDPVAARNVSQAHAAAMREAGALSGLPYALSMGVMSGIWVGPWASLESEAREAVALCEETGQEPTLGYALYCVARLTAAWGREDECRRAVSRALELGERAGLGSVISFATAALGFLELSLGRIAQAIEVLERAQQGLDEQGIGGPTLVPVMPDLIESYVRAGRGIDAVRMADRLTGQAEATGGRWALGAAARCRALTSDASPDAGFALALELHDGSLPFERARTLLAYGQRLHRLRRREEARTRLREAIDILAELDARPWLAVARGELRAAGAVTRTARPPTVLSPQEWRVALAVSRGATNREVAAQLFLSPRTVESHLEQIYRKLDLRSRTQLATYAAAKRQGD